MVLVPLISSNRQQAAVEAAMTSACFFGPIMALVAMVAAWFMWVK